MTQKSLGGWAASELDENGFIHIIPLDDLGVHHEVDCACNPEVDEQCEIILLHNAFDKREKYENGELKFN